MAKTRQAVKQTQVFDNQDGAARKKALDATLTDITKRYGDGTIFNLGAGSHLEVEAIPTGSLGIDISLGVGGVPRGRITEVYGPESSGKTTLCLHVVAEGAKDRRHLRLHRYGALPWTRPTPEKSASISSSSMSPSRIPASRPWRSPSTWCVRARWM